MKKKIKCILFDLDGTLINSGPDLLEALNHTLIKNNLQKINSSYLGNLVGGGAAAMLERGYNFFNKTIESNELPLLVNQFLDFYYKNCSVKTKPYKGVLETLENLSLNDYTLAVCTNKSQRLAEKVLKDLKLEKFFKLILGSSEKLKLKPDSQMLDFSLKYLNFIPEESIMVGDSSNDILPSKRLKINSIFVKYGYGDCLNLEPTFKIESISEIIECIEKLDN